MSEDGAQSDDDGVAPSSNKEIQVGSPPSLAAPRTQRSPQIFSLSKQRSDTNLLAMDRAFIPDLTHLNQNKRDESSASNNSQRHSYLPTTSSCSQLTAPTMVGTKCGQLEIILLKIKFILYSFADFSNKIHLAFFSVTHNNQFFIYLLTPPPTSANTQHDIAMALRFLIFFSSFYSDPISPVSCPFRVPSSFCFGFQSEHNMISLLAACLHILSLEANSN